jgi:O-methyltransferase domain
MRLVSEAIYVVAELGVADVLAHGAKGMTELAAATGVDAAALHRVIRALCEFDLFCELEDGKIALTPTGELLRGDVEGSLRPAAMLFGGDRAARLVGQLRRCVAEGKSVAELLFAGSWTRWLQSDPEQTALFHSAMTSYSALQVSGLLDAYDFSAFSVVVDVGGGHGRSLCEILKRHPALRGILIDMPHALEGARKTMASAGTESRCEIVAGDFFEAVPARADGYLLSRVIHDWDDARALAALRVIRRAAGPSSRLIVVETLLRPGADSPYPVLSDLNMLIRTGGRERSEDEFRALYREAGFQLTRIIPMSSPFAAVVIEGSPI